MRNFIFYTNEGYTEGPNGEMANNCQILGGAKGETEREAFDNLLNENPWITKCGFNIESGSIIARELMDDKRYTF